jgi:steroid 5-alpha reductase family enzyme
MLSKILSGSALVIVIYMTLAFLIALRQKRNDLADVAWGLGFIVIAIAATWMSSAITFAQIAILLLVAAWGVRLAGHVYARNRGKPEDFRYAQWRREWGRHVAIRSFLQVFMLQGLFMWLVSFPIMVANAAAAEIGTGWIAAGALVWIVGFGFESIGDAQLARFRADPANKGHIIASGLWRYSRHPNYFGEVVQWWGIGLIALGAPLGWLGLVGPVAITLLIRYVSGVPMLEKHFAGRPEWEEYKRRTNIFIPWFPRS